MERPRLALETKTTTSTSYEDIVALKVSDNACGVSYFVLSIDPDPNALYQIIIAKMLHQNDLELTAIWTATLPHLTKGVYDGFLAGDSIIVRHKSTTGVSIKSSVSLEMSEVVEEKREAVQPRLGA